jgi:hypothetical protein
VTQATAEVSHLSDNVRQLTDTVGAKSREIKELTQDSQSAKVSAARAEGELAAAKRQVDQLLQDRQVAEARLSAHVTPAAVAVTLAATQPAVSVSASAAATQPALPALSGGATTRPLVSATTAQPAKP